MPLKNRSVASLLLAAGAIFVLGAHSAALAQKGRKISVGDDPSVKEGSPNLVIIEVLDYQ